MRKSVINPRKYSKTKTDKAGEVLRLSKSTEKEKIEALDVLSNWRAAHSYPMHIFTKRLNRVSETMDKKAVTAQRLKRVPSIIKKLNRRYAGEKATMKLTQMQDIAGCRVVLSNLKFVQELYQKYYGASSDIRHIKFNEKNYIENPKKDGYRSIHLVYKYRSDKKEKKKYDGLLIEVQIRSELQHIWATAVETVDFFTGQAIKSNEGKKEWRTFFRSVSAAFAMTEKTTPVPGTPLDRNRLFPQIKKMESELNVISKMKGWTDSVRIFDDIKKHYVEKKNYHFFLLELDTIQDKLTISAYSKRNEEKAVKAYAEAEKKIFGRKEYDVVLVSTDTFAELKRAYPNYFIDTRGFIKELEKIINKY